MDAVSRVAGALAIALMSTVALAVEPPPYRVIVFEGEIGDGFTSVGGFGVNLDRWPSVGDGGDGLRFRFASETVVVGTVYEEAQSTAPLWAARWQLGHVYSRTPLPGPGFAGTVVGDANRDGNIVGAVILPNSNTIAAAAWNYTSGTLAGEPELHLAFEATGLPDCYGTVPDTVLTAVGPRAGSSGSALVAGIGGLVIAGGLPDGILGELQLSGGFNAVKRFPGTNAAEWCGTWTSANASRASFGQCVAWAGAQEPAVWDQFTVIGSAHDTGGMEAVLCDDAKLWDFCRWTTSEQIPLIRHCRGCPPGAASGLEPCAQVSRDELWHSFATNIRLSSFVPPDPELARPLALGGLAGVRTVPAGEACNSDGPCALAHAVAVISSGGLPSPEMSLLDLHSVLPWGTPYDPEQPESFLASGIARLVAWPRGNGDGDGSTIWAAVGAVGNDFERGQDDIDQRGCIWLGRGSPSGETQWCALDVNELTIRPHGLTIEALHDMNSCGLAIGVARIGGSQQPTTMRLVYLTEAADLNGDLVADAGDLGPFLACWGSQGSNCNHADLDRDGIVGAMDLGLLPAAWVPHEGGCEVGVSLTCDGSTWRSPLERYPYIELAAQALGFESVDDLGATVSLLPPESALGICELVAVVATALEGEE